MEIYIKNYELYNNIVVYNFNLGDGGIGDNIKFFMIVLESCMKNNKRLYYMKNNIDIEKYIKLKYEIMYVNRDIIMNLLKKRERSLKENAMNLSKQSGDKELFSGVQMKENAKKLDSIEIVKPYMFYSSINHYNYSLNINDVFYFTDQVKINSKCLFPQDIHNYISIHLRLGDKYLETNKIYIQCKDDTRFFSEEKIDKFIEENSNQNIFFCCDNMSYKLKLKKKYNNIIITNCDIGHTSLKNTKPKQVLDAITELYILTNSKMIFAASESGFSVIASLFNNIPLII
jgi:hypothetical protein